MFTSIFLLRTIKSSEILQPTQEINSTEEAMIRQNKTVGTTGVA